MTTQTLSNLIVSGNRLREERERRERTVARNVARGRCPDCRKKPYGCRCKGE